MFQAVPPLIIRSTKLYIEHQVFVRPMLLPAAIVEEMELMMGGGNALKHVERLVN